MGMGRSSLYSVLCMFTCIVFIIYINNNNNNNNKLTCALDTTSMSHVEVVHAQNEMATRVKKEGKNPAVLKLLGMPRNPTPTM